MRKLLLVLLVAAAVTTGCIDAFDDDAGETIEFVPDGVEAVVQLDMAVLDDPTTEELVDGLIELETEEAGEAYDGPESYDDILDEIEEETELDPRGLQEATAFGGVPDDPVMADADDDEWAVVMSTTWSEDEVLEDLGREATVEEDSYNGLPFYTVTPDSEFEDEYYAASLDDGVFAVGDEGAVQDSVDVAVGDAEPLSGDLRDEIERLDEGYVSFAVDVPEDTLSDTEEPGMEFDTGVFDEVTVVSGSYYTDEDVIGTSLNLRTGDESSAEELEEGIDGLLAFAGMTVPEDLEEMLESVEVSREDSTVELSYETSVQDLVETLEELDDMDPAHQGMDEDHGFDEAEDDWEEEFEEDWDPEFEE